MGLAYTGVGSRETPKDICNLMTVIAKALGQQGYRLRSGGAEGADLAFEQGAMLVDSPRDIFRPAGDQTRYSDTIWGYPADRWAEAYELASRTHPAWHRCGAWARKLHTRNVFQVLGYYLDSPSEFLICWTQDGAFMPSQCSIRTGGTGMAIRIAGQANVPVFNLKNLEHQVAVMRLIVAKGEIDLTREQVDFFLGL